MVDDERDKLKMSGKGGGGGKKEGKKKKEKKEKKGGNKKDSGGLGNSLGKTQPGVRVYDKHGDSSLL